MTTFERTGHDFGVNDSFHLTIERRDRAPATLELVAGDITRMHVDAIVNAANSALAGGGGVDGAIHSAAGPELMAELRSRYAGCPTGSAVITGAGRLGSHGVRWIVHAVGPVWRGGNYGEEALLRSAYKTALQLADEAGARSVAFPAISCGIYGYPIRQAAIAALGAIREAVGQAHTTERCVFVLFDRQTFGFFQSALEEIVGIKRANHD